VISIIISSKTSLLLQQLSENIKETIGVDFEIISIANPDGRIGICEAYNEGAREAQYSILCFCHEDILFHTQNWGLLLISHLKERDVSLVGILGNTIKTKIPSGVYSSVQTTNRINQLQRLKDNSTEHYLTNPLNEIVSEVAVLDGMFLATIKHYWQKQPFDEQLVDGFHGYDIDFSLSMGKLGKVIVVYDILIEHFSFGGNTADWLKSQFALVKKWESQLPIQTKDVNKNTLNKREIDDLTQITLSILKLKWNKIYAIKYSFLLLTKAPLRRINLSILKQLIITCVE